MANKLIPMRGEIDVALKLDTHEKFHSFIVSDHIDTDFLLGMDSIRLFEMSIDIPMRQVNMPKMSYLRFRTEPIMVNQRTKIRCSKTIKIPANTALFINGKLPKFREAQISDKEGITEPYHQLTKRTGVVVTGTISNSTGNHIPIHCLNVMPWEVTIYKNQLIAFIEPFQKLDCIKNIKRVRDTRDYDASIDLPRLATADPIEVTREEGRWPNPEELHKQLKIDKIDIPNNYKDNLKTLISEYSHVFSKDKFDLGCASFYEAQLNLKRDYVPKWIPTRPTSYNLEPHLEKEISNLEKSGQISPIRYSLWNSPVFLVPKVKSGGTSYRFVTDARAMNSMITRDHYELPKIKNLLDNVTEGNYWSSFDLTSSFTQVGLQKNSREITAFTFKNRRFMWNRMIQGQANSSAEFSRCMALLFQKVPFKCLLVYIDDILLASTTISEHLRRLKFVLQRLEWANLKLSPSKTNLIKREAKFCGIQLSEKGLQIDENKIKAIRALPPCQSVKHVQKFLGMLNFNRMFIKNIAKLAAPLYRLLRKGIRFLWTDECQQSMDSLKEALTTAPILGFPDYSDKYKSYEITCDSSALGHGAVLTQFDGVERKIISYFSKSVPKHHQKLGSTKLEMLGLLASLKHYRPYIHGTTFKIKTDCRALLHWETIFSKENSFITRKLAQLSGYNFTIEHVSGESNDIQIADYLSRYGPFKKTFANCAIQTDLDPEILPQEGRTLIDKVKRVVKQTREEECVPVTLDDIRQDYPTDMILSQVIAWIKAGKRPEKLDFSNSDSELCHYWKNFGRLSLIKDILYYKRYDPNNKLEDSNVIVIPSTLIETTMRMFHNTIANCHPGAKNSTKLCVQKFYFYQMKENFELWVNACLICQRTKTDSHAFRKAPLKPIVYSDFNQSIIIDHLEPSKKATSRGYTSILTITCMFSSYLVAVPQKTMTSEEVIKSIIEHWILRFGMFENIHHDLASNFNSKLFKAILDKFNIRDRPGTSFHSQTQGRIEAQNRRLNRCFRACLTDTQYQEWDIWLKYIVFALNATPSSRFNMTANKVVFGRQLKMPRDLFTYRLGENNTLRDETSQTTIQKHVYDLHTQMRAINLKVQEATQKSSKYMSTQYDKKVKGPFFEEKQYCFLLVNVPNHKFAEKWKGPYLITKKINNWNYIINIGSESKVVNIQKMKLYKTNQYSTVSNIPQVSEIQAVSTADTQDTHSGINPQANTSRPDFSSPLDLIETNFPISEISEPPVEHDNTNQRDFDLENTSTGSVSSADTDELVDLEPNEEVTVESPSASTTQLSTPQRTKSSRENPTEDPLMTMKSLDDMLTEKGHISNIVQEHPGKLQKTTALTNLSEDPQIEQPSTSISQEGQTSIPNDETRSNDYNLRRNPTRRKIFGIPSPFRSSKEKPKKRD